MSPGRAGATRLFGGGGLHPPYVWNCSIARITNHGLVVRTHAEQRYRYRSLNLK